MSRQDQKSSRISEVSRSVRRRRERLLGPVGLLARASDALATPSMGTGLIIALLFALFASAALILTGRQPLVAVGRVMDETRLVRREIVSVDDGQTQQRREAARQATPRVYIADLATLDAIAASLENLPTTLASAEDLESVDPGIREQFGLSPEALAAIKGEAAERAPAWARRVSTLHALLRRRPFLDAQTWQRGSIEGTGSTIRAVVDNESFPLPRGETVNIEDADAIASAARVIAREAGFDGSLRNVVVARLTRLPKPTFAFEAAATAQDQNAAAEGVTPVQVVSPVGQVIFRRGEVLTEPQAALYRDELEAFESITGTVPGWLRAGGLAGAACAITLALAGYTVLFCPRIRRRAGRMIGVAGILAGTLAIACAGTAAAPQWASLTAVTPTVLVAMLMVIAYDRRAALAYALLHGLLVCIALRESLGTFAVIVTGIACVVWSLKEIRDRNTLFRASVFTAAGVSLARVVFSAVERPLMPGVIGEALVDAALAGGGALAMGGATLFVLPLLERAFNVTTGMTLIDLRDPKQPLLRELQQRAPGTYTHSLNVATIAEGAAEAIGADGLLTYVGALYHDIGKMNKPEYFVENQQGGPNKHDRLSPAMSLLIIVGHVKDGLELAREFRLAPRIQHFIEAHHGTTLVEFFFHRARKQAVGAGADEDAYVPDEFEYRYPGPRPRTREVAIVMIADAAESAARAMSDPTPARVDTLVRSIANKRLMDGQFDDCELTLRELAGIVESVSRTLASMHHGRVAYPESLAATL